MSKQYLLHRLLMVVVFSFMSASCTPAVGGVGTSVAFPNLSFSNPIDLQHAPDGSNRLFVVEQAGVIRVFENDPSVPSSSIFLDIRSKVLSGGELGLLGLAFDPNYADSGYFYVNYTTDSPRRTVIARYKVSPGNSNVADPTSEVVILQIGQPYSNHNGGQIAFGPDGYLYIGMGDGGSGGDPDGHGQDRTTLLGDMLRIDVANTTGNLNYAIPPDNPFVGNTEGYREEIYAYGLRNPWRFSFDPVTGWLWAGDVGQNAYEEVDIIEKGGNYGWKIMEGFHCFNAPTCDTTGLLKPIWEYDHNQGVSITGGHVYRGTRVPELVGKYLYSDYGSGTIWALQYDGMSPAVNEVLINTGLNVVAFGTDREGELYFCALNGRIYRFEFIASVDDSDTRQSLRLQPNEPNPFSTSTTITYTLERASHVILTVSDLLGRTISTLVDRQHTPGVYSAEFSGDNLAAGVYFCTLTDGADVHQTVRMVVAR